jgi:short-subunit dehydrogenase
VRALLAAGASRVYATARNRAQLDALVAEGRGRVVALTLDVTDRTAIAALPKQAAEVRILINNAGLFEAATALAGGDGSGMFAVNYTAPLLLTRAFAPQLAGGAVVNINSIASLVNFPLAPLYSDSKAAAHSLTVAQRRELRAQRTQVVGVYPGPIDTDMADGIPFAKVPASTVADAIIAALRHGTEDVFPDPMAQQLAAGVQADAKAVERQMAQG